MTEPDIPKLSMGQSGLGPPASHSAIDRSAPAQAGDDAKPSSVEGYAKLLAFLAVTTYAIGLIAVNGYLSQWGFSNFSDVKPRFILTGALVTLMIAGILLVEYSVATACRWVLTRQWRGLRARARALPGILKTGNRVAYGTGAISVGFLTYELFTMVVGAAVSLLAPMLVLLLYLNRGPNRETAVEDALVLFLATIAVGLAGSVFYHFDRAAMPGSDTSAPVNWRKRHAFVGRVASASVGAAFLVVLVSLFGRSLYPLMPDRLGGGQPKMVQLVFSDDGAKTARQVLSFTSKDGTVTNPHCMLFDGDTGILLALRPEGHGPVVIQINHELIVGIHILEGDEAECQPDLLKQLSSHSIV